MKTIDTRQNKRQSGFSLIELMIVIAIIGLLIGVGVPAWQYMVKNGNEVAAASSVRQITERQAQYASRKKDFGNFDELIKETGFNENFKGEKPVVNGYVYTLKVEKRAGGKTAFWSVNADPESPNGGTRHFYTDSTLSNIRFNDEGEANAQSPPL